MTLKPVFALLIAILLMQMSACTKNNNVPSASVPVTAASIAGDFTVNSFVTGSDQTSTFDGYTFTFLEKGTVTATKENTTINGTWKFDDSDNTELKINFPSAPLNGLNKGWHIAELTTEHMLLTDDDNSEDSNDDHPSSHSRLDFERD